MAFSKLKTILLLIFIVKIYSQQKYITKYENGKTKTESFINKNTLDSIYKEYYQNGNLKTEGFYKDCEYKTNRKGIYIAGCGVGKEKDTIQVGKKHGIWKNYYENGTLSYTANYHCNIMQGNNFSYNKDGKLETIEFYNEGKLMYAQEFNENGIVVETSDYKYEVGKNENFKKVHIFQFYDNGDLKSENTLEESNKKDIETYKEYFYNGFLKIEKNTINNEKVGVYREYFENGNIKYEGIFDKNIPVKKQYFYNEDGSVSKIETWKNGKLLKTQPK
ncbi:MORN repeat variant [compost metagenome]